MVVATRTKTPEERRKRETFISVLTSHPTGREICLNTEKTKTILKNLFFNFLSQHREDSIKKIKNYVLYTLKLT